MEKDFEIDITNPIRDFDAHLALEGNARILFSGPFGAGKTYFLSKYFDPEKFEVIRLAPVNYSVASNEDIFELIKYDLLFELLGKDVDLEKEDFSRLLTLQLFLINNSYNFIKTIAGLTDKVDKSIFEIVDKLDKLENKFEKFKEEVKIDDERDIIKYLKTFTNKKGSIYEEDVNTQLISNLVEQLKEKGKETILIIDDLDRIDPEHIFRLLNVFAAHFDLQSHTNNKFGFEKIILVCDVENIRNIFKAKYGPNTDFSGYIDKFYSKEIFYFQNVLIQSAFIEYNTPLIQVTYPESGSQVSILASNDYFDGDISYILAGFVHARALNTKTLIKLNNFKIRSRNYHIQFGNSRRTFISSNFRIIKTFDFLSDFFGDPKKLEVALIKSSNINVTNFTKIDDDEAKRKIGQLILVLSSEIHKYEFSMGDFFIFTDSDTNIEYNVRVQQNPFNKTLEGKIEGLNRIGENATVKIFNLNYFNLLKRTFQKLQQDFNLFNP